MQTINLFTPKEKEERGSIYGVEPLNEDDFVMPSIETVVDEKTGQISRKVVFKKAPDDRDTLKVSDFSLAEIILSGIDPESLGRVDYGNLPESSVDKLVELCNNSVE